MSAIIQYASYAFFIVMPVAGVLLNCYVFARLMRVARRSGTRFESTSGLPLSAMSLSDSICLLATLTQFLFHFTVKAPPKLKENIIIPPPNNSHLSFICKVDLYLLHTTSAFSVWCWLLLSILRYVAVFYPFKYRTIWRQPRHAIKALALACVVAELWILFFVMYDTQHRTCTEDSRFTEKQVKFAHLFDIIVFYFIPSGLRLIFDSLVLFRCYSCAGREPSPMYDRRLAISAPSVDRNNSSFECDSLDPSKQQHAHLVFIASLTTSQRSSFLLPPPSPRRPSYAPSCTSPAPAKWLTPSLHPGAFHYTAVPTNTAAPCGRSSRKSEALSKRRTAMILRSLLISGVNLLFNLPSHVLRMWCTLQEPPESEWIDMMEQLSQILYFSQFACNAFYLSTSIYETSLPPSKAAPISSIGRQISRCESRDADSGGMRRQTSHPF